MAGLPPRAILAASCIEDLGADLSRPLPVARAVPAAPPEALRSPA